LNEHHSVSDEPMSNKKHNNPTRQLKRSAIAKHSSDLVLSSVVALLLCVLFSEFVGIDNLTKSLRHKSAANLLSVLSDTNFSSINLRFREIDSTLLQLGGFLLSALGILIAYALIHLRLTRSEEKRNKAKTSEFQQYFTSIITAESTTNKFIGTQHPRTYLTKSDIYDVNNRSILLQELRSMHSLVGGRDQRRLEDQYYALGFVDELEEKFQSPEWLERAQAINEVIQFKVTSYYPHINKLLIDKNETVRQNAVVAKIKLDDQPLEILKTIDRPLSVWEKHQMFLAVKALPAHKLPSFKELLIDKSIHYGFIKDLEMQLNV